MFPYKLLASAAVLLVIVGIAWFYMNVRIDESGEMATTTGDISGALADLIASGATSTRGDGFTVEIDPETPAIVPPPPSLTRAIPATPDLDAQGRSIIVEKIEASIAALKQDSKLYGSWVDLGMYRHIVKDYVGAREAWEYAAVLGPNTVTPFANLGDLYTFYLKDYAKAEVNLKKAIENDPAKSVRFYRSLYELYTLWKPNSDAPAQALKDGIKAFPDALDLHVLLARYYKDNGKITESRAAYDGAISVATKAGNTEAAGQLQAERP